MDDMVLVVGQDLTEKRSFADARRAKQDGEAWHRAERSLEYPDLGRTVKEPRER